MLVDIGLRTRKQNIALKSLLHRLVHWSSTLVIKHECYANIWPFYVWLVWACQYWTELGSWMVWGRTNEKFEVLVVVVVWGGGRGCEVPQSCELRGRVWLIG